MRVCFGGYCTSLCPTISLKLFASIRGTGWCSHQYDKVMWKPINVHLNAQHRKAHYVLYLEEYMFAVMCRSPKWTHSPCSSTLLCVLTGQNTLCTAIPVFISLCVSVATSYHCHIESSSLHVYRKFSRSCWPILQWGRNGDVDRSRSDIHS